MKRRIHCPARGPRPPGPGRSMIHYERAPLAQGEAKAATPRIRAFTGKPAGLPQRRRTPTSQRLGDAPPHRRPENSLLGPLCQKHSF